MSHPTRSLQYLGTVRHRPILCTSLTRLSHTPTTTTTAIIATTIPATKTTTTALACEDGAGDDENDDVADKDDFYLSGLRPMITWVYTPC